MFKQSVVLIIVSRASDESLRKFGINVQSPIRRLIFADRKKKKKMKFHSLIILVYRNVGTSATSLGKK